jgi:hypothetical protein
LISPAMPAWDGRLIMADFHQIDRCKRTIRMADLQIQKGDYVEALAELKSAIELLERLVNENDTEN